MTEQALYLLAAMGLTIVLVDVRHGPGVWIVRVALRPLLERAIGKEATEALLTCGVCFSAYTGAVVGVAAGLASGDWTAACTLWLAAPAAWWLGMRIGSKRV